MNNWLKSLFSDSDSVSFKRLIGLLAFIAIAVAFYQNLYNNKIIDNNLLYAMTGIVGAATGGAVIEKIIKMKSNNRRRDRIGEYEDGSN